MGLIKDEVEKQSSVIRLLPDSSDRTYIIFHSDKEVLSAALFKWILGPVLQL